ncbi:Clc chloride channel [Rhizoclosmatium globosum]|uniref:Chloride channel protein n=1 Tax=Rhizoclosmatium globosum TaxID=329046 RepID=A0A1Y2C5N3_9FUNG|nr:Clc chloride channel [Rhizoclosmatium globosum]|eukprot:ORY42343.1 Clc chloride channel [Rhizoclosmatium globosum]
MPKDPDEFDTTGNSKTSYNTHIERTLILLSSDCVQDLLADRRRRRALQESLALSPLNRIFESMQSWILLIILGVSLGLAAAFIDVLAAWLVGVRLGHCGSEIFNSRATCCVGFPEDDCPRWISWTDTFPSGWGVYLAFASLFGALASILVVRVAPDAAGGGTPEIKTLFDGFTTSNYLNFKLFVTMALSMPLTVGSGIAVGKEGPFVQLASSLAGAFHGFFPTYRNSEFRKREIIAVAAGSGLAVALGVPIGGTLFALEELAAPFSTRGLFHGYFCALLAYITLQYVGFGGKHIFQFSLTRDWLPIEIIGFLAVGVFGGLSGAFVIKMSQAVGRFRKNTGLDASELLAYLYQECEESNYKQLCEYNRRSVVHRHICSSEPYNRVFGFENSRWYFYPFDGLGQFVRKADWDWNGIFPNQNPGLSVFSSCVADKPCVTPALYAVLGTIAGLGGITRLTMTLAAVFIEMSGSIKYIIPCMIVIMTAKSVADIFGRESMTEAGVRILRYPFLESAESLSLNIIDRPIHESMTPFKRLVVLRKTQFTLQEANRIVKENTGFRAYPVMKTLEGREFLGVVNLPDIIRAIEDAKNRGFLENSEDTVSNVRGSIHLTEIVQAIDEARVTNWMPKRNRFHRALMEATFSCNQFPMEQ